MSNISTWSSTASGNNATPPNGFPELMNPADVNNSSREVMAAVRRWYADPAWIDYGDTVTRTGNTTFTITGDVTTRYVAGLRIRATDSSTLYGVIASSSYSAPNTTVTVTLDSGNLSASLTAVALNPWSAASVFNTAAFGSLAFLNTVANSNMATMAQATIKGRASGAGTGTPTDLTAAEVRTILGTDNINQQVYTSTGAFTFTTPSTITTSTRFKITLTGGGGSGGCSTSGVIGPSGGGAGGTCIAFVTGLAASTGYSGSVGAGGALATAASTNTAGNAGSNTTITIGATTYTGGGGGGGFANGSGSAGGAGGTPTNGTLNVVGGQGLNGFHTGSAQSPASGGASMWGGGTCGFSGANGVAATSYGAGGGAAGGTGTLSSGAGANGVVMIEWVA